MLPERVILSIYFYCHVDMQPAAVPRSIFILPMEPAAAAHFIFILAPISRDVHGRYKAVHFCPGTIHLTLSGLSIPLQLRAMLIYTFKANVWSTVRWSQRSPWNVYCWRSSTNHRWAPTMQRSVTISNIYFTTHVQDLSFHRCAARMSAKPPSTKD